MGIATFAGVFFPLLVVLDPIGTTAIFAALSAETAKAAKKKMVLQALATALILGLVFTFFGHVLLKAIGIEVADLQIAGGIVLLWMSLQDIVRDKTEEAVKLTEQFGVVPLGTPLIIGPGAITTLLMHSRPDTPFWGCLPEFWPVLAALAANLVIIGICLFAAEWLIQKLGRSVAMAVSKVFMLILAAYAVMMIRYGVLAIAPAFAGQ
ncbi:MAG: MarC family protein [Kiritimatiellae bacterium]|jgi:multiple antibiotic resistance protein|nr:MarC family protein [Kiritimatiellia bacterium]